jgi:hypothetical protein
MLPLLNFLVMICRCCGCGQLYKFIFGFYTIMNKSNNNLNSSNSAGKAFLPAGELKAARDFMPHLDDARNLRSAAPVFVTAVDAFQFATHRSGAGSFRMGAMEFDDCVIVTARLQVGGCRSSGSRTLQTPMCGGLSTACSEQSRLRLCSSPTETPAICRSSLGHSQGRAMPSTVIGER